MKTVGAKAVGQVALPPVPSVLGYPPMLRGRCPSHEGKSTYQPSGEEVPLGRDRVSRQPSWMHEIHEVTALGANATE